MKRPSWPFARNTLLVLCVVVFIAARRDEPQYLFASWGDTREEILARLPEPDFTDPDTGAMTWVDPWSLLGRWEMELTFAPDGGLQTYVKRQYVGLPGIYACFPRKEDECTCR